MNSCRGPIPPSQHSGMWPENALTLPCTVQMDSVLALGETFCSAACIPACASKRRKLTFSTSRRRSSPKPFLLLLLAGDASPQSNQLRPASRQIQFLRQNPRSTVFAIFPRRSSYPFDADIDHRTFLPCLQYLGARQPVALVLDVSVPPESAWQLEARFSNLSL